MKKNNDIALYAISKINLGSKNRWNYGKYDDLVLQVV